MYLEHAHMYCTHIPTYMSSTMCCFYSLLQMFEGKERRLQLVHELRTTHALQESGQKLKVKEKSTVIDKQLQEAKRTHKDNVVKDVVEEGAAEVIGKQLDFLNKELMRLQVCVCVCVCVCVRACVRVCVRMFTYVRTYVHMWVHYT